MLAYNQEQVERPDNSDSGHAELLMLTMALINPPKPLASILVKYVTDRIVEHQKPRLREVFRISFGLVDAWADRIARAIAARQVEVRYFHSHNTADNKALTGKPKTFKGPWPMNSNQAFAVYPCDDQGYKTLIFDVDAKTCDPDQASERIRAILNQAGVRFVECISGPEGSRHIFATWHERIPHSQMWRLFRLFTEKVRLRVDSTPMRNPTEGCIRPPLARHYSWGRSNPVGDVNEALRVLEEGNSPEAWHRLAEALAVPLLPRKVEAALFGGLGTGYYRSRSEIVAAVAVAHVNARSTETLFRADILDLNNAGGEKVQKRRNSDRYISQEWAAACRFVEQRPISASQPKTPDSLIRVFEAVQQGFYNFKGQAGQTDRMVLLGLLRTAKALGRVRFHEASRDLAMFAGVHLESVWASLKRLKAAGVVNG